MSSTRSDIFTRACLLALCLSAFLIHPALAQETCHTVQLRITQTDIKEPVRLQSVSIKTEIAGRLAETTIDMVFHNPNNRVLEGQLQFPLFRRTNHQRFCAGDARRQAASGRAGGTKTKAASSSRPSPVSKSTRRC